MRFFHALKQPDINQAVNEYRDISGAILLDARTPQEYREGHIPGSVNLPLQSLDNAEEIIENEDTPIYIYCYSGSRSRQAAAILGAMGYTYRRHCRSFWKGGSINESCDRRRCSRRRYRCGKNPQTG